MTLSRGQFTNVISKGKKMGYKNPTGPQKFKKKELYPVSNKDIEFLSQKRKLQMGITKELYPVSDRDIKFIKKNMPKTKKKKSKNPHKD